MKQGRCSMARAKVSLTPGQFRLGFLVHDVSRLRRTVVDKALGPLGITRSQWWVLANLSRHDGEGMMQTELARVLDIGKVALGGLLDRLESNGYVARKPDPVDRRAKRIEMTDAGADLLAAIQDRAAALNRQMMAGITAQEIAATEDILHRMKQRLLEMDSQLRTNSEDIVPANDSTDPLFGVGGG
ncbi:MarR family winged helix-turn-helix transcriptional regulator [Sphingosinicella terrae]|uniref:MarR family winged helix-turn-helix transcriptional regulator n=1 Tax=Sphingosinicella terrae TaxID=2172047 RepID=UPI0025477DCC|nr:MarR family transcriptional regulator [Sphingosinicella terrae]